MASSKPLHESAKRLLQALVEAPSTGSTLDDVLFGVSKNIIEEAYLQLLEGKTKVEIEGQGDRLSAYLVRQNEGDRREVLSLREIDVTKESLKSLFQFEGHQSAQGEVEELAPRIASSKRRRVQVDAISISSDDGELVIEEQPAPIEEQHRPFEEQHQPFEEQRQPPEDESVPVEEEYIPVDDDTTPVEEESMPVEEESMPVEEESMPVEEESTSVEERMVKNGAYKLAWYPVPVKYRSGTDWRDAGFWVKME